jgi:ABC-type Fe3+ transport system permease subunit
MDVSALANLAYAGVGVFGAVLCALALAAFRRTRSGRMGLVAGGFLLMAIEGVVVGVGLFTGGWALSTLLLLSALFEVALLAVLFAATLMA